MKINNVYNLNCLDGMKLLDDEIIDLTVTSPPYDNMRNYKGYSFDFESIAKELYRITKQGGVVVWVVGDQTIQGSETGTSFKQALFFKEIGFNLHDTMIYAKNNPMPVNANRYYPCFEYMFVFSKGKPKTFNPILEETATKGQKHHLKQRNTDGSFRKATGYGKPVKPTRPKYNIWFYNVGGGQAATDKIAYKHPAIFPEELAQDHILSWSNKKDLVFDPFMGSGTTAKMAILNDRNWLGFEISEEYCEMTKKRVSGLYPQNDIFDFMEEEK